MRKHILYKLALLIGIAHLVVGCAHQQKTIRFNHWVLEDESARELIVQRGDTLDITARAGMTPW